MTTNWKSLEKSD